MPKLSEILSPSIRSALRPQVSIISASRADDSDFCHDVVARGWLTEDQMRHASGRYRLGKSKSGRTIFWMVDELGCLRDGHLGDSWVSQILKARAPQLMQSYHVRHCLFGQHLLSTESGLPVSIVESEQSAVILSELLPESLWMAYATLPNLTPDLLAPLEGRNVIIYPRTAPSMNTYLFFLDYANQVRRLYPTIHLSVDSTLEDHATEDQKSRCIDLLDFILE